MSLKKISISLSVVSLPVLTSFIFFKDKKPAGLKLNEGKISFLKKRVIYLLFQ